MSSEESKQKKDSLRIIREMCNSIIHETHSYLNDGNTKRLSVMENEIENIFIEIEKIRN